jgi:hypothetical protein
MEIQLPIEKVYNDCLVILIFLGYFSFATKQKNTISEFLFLNFPFNFPLRFSFIFSVTKQKFGSFTNNPLHTEEKEKSWI